MDCWCGCNLTRNSVPPCIKAFYKCCVVGRDSLLHDLADVSEARSDSRRTTNTVGADSYSVPGGDYSRSGCDPWRHSGRQRIELDRGRSETHPPRSSKSA